MTLMDIVIDINNYDENKSIYVEGPWEKDSLSIIAFGEDAQHNGLDYFLQVSDAQEFLQDWSEGMSFIPTPEEACRVLIEYAEAKL